MAQQVSQNTFIKGLLMDTSPLQLDSATLSNALNATLVTMNGNEVILQNDMGNARVDNAYLPTGYVPIGMKEYGGVIYVAAYNPITNRGQLGSFPSPERRFGSEYKGLISGEVDINNFFNNSRHIELPFDPVEYNINQVEEAIKTDTILVPLIKFYRNNNNNNNIENLNIIRAGDKFSIYDLDGIIWGENGYKKYLSNFDNVDENGEANLLKNNIITFSIGVLNSQNEFVDITNSLRRFNESAIIEEKGSKTDMFNTGYFISTASSKPEPGPGPDPENTRADKELIEERNKLAINTYGQKLVGPLYLKMLLNVIKDFEYAIYGNKEEGENVYKLIIYSYYKYNFPDGYFRNRDMSERQSWEGSRNALLNLGYINNCLKFGGHDLAYEGKRYGPYTYIQINGISKKRSSSIESIQYNTTSNLYSSSSKAEITFSTEETEVPYILLPGLSFGGMKNLKVEGVIDLSKLGSGLFELNNWRYYNSDGELTITYGWESYPRYGEEISDIKFEFIDIYENKIKSTWDPRIVDKTYYVENRESYNGVFNVTLGLEENNLSPNTLYLVKISHTSTYNGSSEQKYEYRFILTTGLFNDCYFKSSSNFIKDYGKPKNLNGAIYPNHDLHTYVKGTVNGAEVNLKYAEDPVLGKGYIYNTTYFVKLNEGEEDLIVDLEHDLYGDGQYEEKVTFTELIYGNYTKEALIYHNKLKIEFDFDINYTDYGNSSEETYGNLISRNAANLLKFGYIKKYNIDLALNYNLHEINPDYYPLLIQGILPVTTGATFSPTTLVPVDNEAPPRPDLDTDGTGSSTNENHVINPVYRIDPSLDYSGGIGTGTLTGSGSSGSGSGGSGSSGSGNDNSEENTEESTPSNYVESEGESNDPNAIDAWLNLDLDKDIEQIQYKIGNKSISVDWKDFELDSNDDETYLTKSKITFYQDSGNISGYLNVYDKCIAGGESNGTVTVTNAFMSIYDHLKNIFSMYDGKLFGYVLWANNEKKSNKTIAIVENADVLENTYYSKNNNRTNHTRPADYYPGYPNPEQNPPSYLMTFNSAESSDQDQYTKYDTNWYNNSGRNTSLSMSDKRFGIKKVQEMWDLKNTKYSIVGMMNADYLGTELKDWSDELVDLSKKSQFCRVWWKTTEDGIYALFPMMWRNIHLNVTYPTGDTDGQYYKYNTPLSKSIGEANDDNNIFKLYLNDFVFTLGTDETVNNIFVVDLLRLTKTKKLYNVELLVLAKIRINIPSGNINSFNNKIRTNLGTTYNPALMEFRCDDKKEANLQDYCNLKYPSSNKVDILILESRKYITGGDCLDISYGNIYDKYGRTLTKGAIYLVNDDKTLELNKNLNDYFKIDLENKTICIDASKINYSPLKYKCRYISRESAAQGSMGVKAYAHGCYPRMNEEYPIFKDLEDVPAKDWERV